MPPQPLRLPSPSEAPVVFRVTRIAIRGAPRYPVPLHKRNTDDFQHLAELICGTSLIVARAVASGVSDSTNLVLTREALRSKVRDHLEING